MSENVIHNMATYFAAAGDHHDVDAPTFAASVLASNKAHIERQSASGQIVAVDALALLHVELGDPAQPVDAPIAAHINAGRWIAKCECSGCEFVDFTTGLFMCCSCWNAAYGHRWRRVITPPSRAEAASARARVAGAAAHPAAVPTRDEIEALLLARPHAMNRNWHPGETLAELQAENDAHGVAA